MKKILILLLLLSLAWLVKLSYDVWALTATQNENVQQLHQLQKQNATVNDQLVSIKRQLSEQVSSNIATSSQLQQQVSAEVASPVATQGILIVQRQLDLIEFALQQQQFNLALQKLQALELEVDTYSLAPALAESIQLASRKDQQAVKQMSESRLKQINSVSDLISQLEREFSQELNAQHQNQSDSKQASFWSRWIQIESVKTPSVVLMQRGIVIKEAQLRLLGAQNALQQGQALIYQQAVDGAIQDLSQLPDARSREWIKQLEQIKGMPLTPAPVLNTRNLLSE